MFLAIIAIAYPVLVFTGLARFSVREIGIVLGVMLVLRVGFGLWSGRLKSIKPLLLMAFGFAVPLTLAIALNSEFALRILPVMMNLSMLFVFGTSLWSTPMIERFARMQVTDLSARQKNHCRKFTQFWCAFFASNILVIFLLSWAPRSWWALYTGVISYGLMGVLLTSEFIVRRYKFREFSPYFYDRMLIRIFPDGAG